MATTLCTHCYCGTTRINNVEHPTCHKCSDVMSVRPAAVPVPYYPQPVYSTTTPWYPTWRYGTYVSNGSGGNANTLSVSGLAESVEWYPGANASPPRMMPQLAVVNGTAQRVT